MREKERRSRDYNQLLSQAERPTESTNTGNDTKQNKEAPGDQAAQTGDSRVQNTTTKRTSNSVINKGDQVWLFMERVKPGLKTKLVHRWHGPLRVKKQIKELAFKLKLPDGN